MYNPHFCRTQDIWLTSDLTTNKLNSIMKQRQVCSMIVRTGCWRRGWMVEKDSTSNQNFFLEDERWNGNEGSLFLSQTKTVIFPGSGQIVKTSKQIQVDSKDAMDSLSFEEWKFDASEGNRSAVTYSLLTLGWDPWHHQGGENIWGQCWSCVFSWSLCQTYGTKVQFCLCQGLSSSSYIAFRLCRAGGAACIFSHGNRSPSIRLHHP